MDVNTGSIIEPKSTTITPPVSSIGVGLETMFILKYESSHCQEMDACPSSLPPIDDDLVRVMENDPSGGIVLDRSV